MCVLFVRSGQHSSPSRNAAGRPVKMAAITIQWIPNGKMERLTAVSVFEANKIATFKCQIILLWQATVYSREFPFPYKDSYWWDLNTCARAESAITVAGRAELAPKNNFTRTLAKAVWHAQWRRYIACGHEASGWSCCSTMTSERTTGGVWVSRRNSDEEMNPRKYQNASRFTNRDYYQSELYGSVENRNSAFITQAIRMIRP